MFTEKMETVVTMVSSRSTVNEPRIADAADRQRQARRRQARRR